MTKTNAVRLVELAGIACRTAEYDYCEQDLSGLHAAQAIGMPPEQVFKTLVAQNPKHEHFVFIIPAVTELDLKKAAHASGQKSIEMIPQKELFPLTGYIHGGCSPIGMKKLFPTYLDETAILFDFICVSGGKVGTNVGVNPEKLAEMIPAKFADLSRG